MRTDGDLRNMSNIWPDFGFVSGLGVTNWASLMGDHHHHRTVEPLEDFHDVQILGDTLTFQPEEATTQVGLPLVSDHHC